MLSSSMEFKNGLHLDEAAAISQNTKLFVDLQNKGYTADDALREIMTNVKTFSELGPIQKASDTASVLETVRETRGY